MTPALLLPAHNPGPMTGAGNNTYLLTGRGAAVLIDAGVGDARHLDAIAGTLNAARASLDTVLVTHGHPDHASGAAALAAAHPGASFLKRPWPGQDQQFDVRWKPLGEGEVIDAGGTALTVLHTPGHSPDHLAFWDRAGGAIFTGDLVVLGSSVMIHRSKGGDLAEYMRSLERLLALEPRVLFPAHGPRVDHPAALLKGYLEHRRLRERQILEALGAGHATVEAIAESIYHGLASELMAAARENVRAHLDKLQSEGVAAEDNGRWRL